MAIDRYTFPFPPERYNNIIPFTYRDGLTYIQVLSSLREWLLETLIPHVDGEIERLANLTADQIDALVGAVSAAETARDAAVATATALAGMHATVTQLRDEATAAAEASLASSGSAETARQAAVAARQAAEAVAAGLSSDSVVRAVLGQAGGESRTYLDGLYEPTAVKIAPLMDDAPVTDALDALYARKAPVRNIMVAIGSSNAEGAGDSVPGLVAADLGMTLKNHAQSGGAFANDSFLSQLTNARDNATFNNADVGFVLILDASNDVRAKVSGTHARARTVFQSAKSWFPNARILVVPVLWPPNPRDDASLAGVGGYQDVWPELLVRNDKEIIEAARAEKIEVALHSPDWHAGNTAWQVPGEVHFTQSGRWRTAEFILAHLRGESTDFVGEWLAITNTNGSTGTMRSIRTNQVITVSGTVTTGTAASGAPPMSDVGVVALRDRPSGFAQITGYLNSTSVSVPVMIYWNGTMRLWGNHASGTTVLFSGSYDRAAG